MAASRGGHGASLRRRLCPTCLQSVGKNGKNHPFSAKFLEFCPLRIAFCPLDAPHKKILVPPLIPTTTPIPKPDLNLTLTLTLLQTPILSLTLTLNLTLILSDQRTFYRIVKLYWGVNNLRIQRSLNHIDYFGLTLKSDPKLSLLIPCINTIRIHVVKIY